MTHPAPHRLLACVLSTVAVTAGGLVATASPVAAAGAAGGHAATAVAAATARSTPLRVTLETLAPGTIPRRGRVTLTGRIYNRSDEEWTDLNAYLLTSRTPLRTRKALAEAAASDPDAEIGKRRAGEGLFDRVGDLAPGQSVHYRLSVSRADLGISGDPGVYWVGVHVLGASAEGRDLTADGRARTFMPLLPDPGTIAAARDQTRLAVLVPVQKPVQRGSAGRVVDTGSWDDTLAPDGRLGRLLTVTAGVHQPLTWVIDPAVLDAVRSLAQGNPPADAPDTGPPGEADQSEADQSEVTRRAAAWLKRFRRQAPFHTVAAVPYGDLDVAAALQAGLRSVYRLGTQLSDDVLGSVGIEGFTPVVDPVGGFLPEAALERLDASTTVVLGRAALPGSAAPVVRRAGTAPVVLTDTSAEGGGPRPNSQFAALAVRQRLLSEAALHAMSADRVDPLVVSMPEYWNPGDAALKSRFFAGLDTSWLTLVDLPAVVAAAPTPAGSRGTPADLVYPEADRVEPVPLGNLLATQNLVRTAGVFAALLTGPDTVVDRFSRVAMLASSSAARTDPELALRLVQGSAHYIRSEMAKVRVEGPQFVMMSGESGLILVTLVNGLDRSVRVGLTVSTPGSDMRIRNVDPVTLGPRRRTSIRLKARSNDIGVHAVTLTPVNADRVPLGTATQLSVRTSNVSKVIWVVMAVGGTLLFLAIVVRLYRRVRLRKRTYGPSLPGTTGGTTGGTGA